jgi:hypothetical protein
VKRVTRDELTVEKQLDQDVNAQHAVRANMLVRKAPHKEKQSQYRKPCELERLAADSVDSGNGKPVPRNCPSADQDAVTCGKVVKFVVDSGAAAVSDSLENSGRI